MSPAPRRVLFCSRDVGSVQAMAPVALALGEKPGFETHTLSMARSRFVLDEAGVAHEPLDEAAFERDPAGYLDRTLERVRPDLVVSGSSPARGEPPETPEQHLTLAASRFGAPSLAILDFWGMYSERFCDHAGLNLDLVPDTLCALDETCRRDLAALGIPADRLRVTHNPWMDRIAAGSAPERPVELDTDALTILFVSQPLAENASRGWGYTQDSLVAAISGALPEARKARLFILPHPAEDQDRWRAENLPSRAGLDIRVLKRFHPGFLAHCDLMATSHSTMAYQAPYYGTPCLCLAIGGKLPENFITNTLGLSTPLTTEEDLRAFFAEADTEVMRRELLERRAELAARNIFFSDGRATDRVCGVIGSILAGDAEPALLRDQTWPHA